MPQNPNSVPAAAAAEDEETQVLDDVPDSPPRGGADPAGETQRLDDEDTAVVDLWGETQVVDDSEDGGGTETTEVLSDDDDDAGLRDDAAMSGGVEEGGGGEETEVVAESDATTEDESDGGSAKKSFATVRTSSLRSSGLAAARSIIPKMIDTVEDTSEGVHIIEKLNGTTDTSHGTQAGKVDRDHMLGISNRCIEDCPRDDDAKSRSNNPRVRKLFDDVSSPGNMESGNTDHVIRTVDSPHSLFPDYASGGLSYVGSQEPGDMSQANALDVVDEFLLVNNMELSQETKSDKKDLVKSTPIVSSIGPQTLARKADHRSPVGKNEIFEWKDSQEDDRGGEFFNKIKDTFFEIRGTARKSHKQSSKACRFSSKGRDPPLDSGVKPKPNLSLTTSDSGLGKDNTSGNGNIHKSLPEVKKTLLKNMDGPLSSEQQLETTDVDGAEEGNYDVGPDTQMAAEAMEELLHGRRDNCEFDKDVHLVAVEVAEPFIKAVPKKKRSANRRATPDLVGIGTGSKRRKVICDKSKRESTDTYRRVTRSLRDRKTSGDTNALMKISEVEMHLDARNSVNGHGSSRPLTRKKSVGTVDKTFNKGPEKGTSSLTLNAQLLVTKEPIPYEYQVNTTPVARRTRHSIAANSLKKVEASSGKYGADKNHLTGMKSNGAIRKADKLAAAVTAPGKPKRKYSSIVPDESANAEKETPCHTDTHDTGGPHVEEANTGSPLKGFIGHPKRKRTTHVEEANTGSPLKGFIGHPKRKRTSRTIQHNSTLGGNFNYSSVCPDGVATTSVQPSTREGKPKRFIRSVSEILSAKRQKKRSVSARAASRLDNMTLGTGKPERLCVKTRSSVNSLLIKPSLGKESEKCPARLLWHKDVSNDAANNCSSALMNHNIDVGRKLDGSPKENGRLSEPSYTTPSKAKGEASPVCMGQDFLRAPCSKALSSSSIRRELNKLESTESLPTLLKDSRRRNYMSSVRVLFSNHLDEDTIKQQKKILTRLGVQVASSMSDASHFVTDKFVRTKNMLEAMSLGKPVVTPMWLKSCGQASCFIDVKKYILRDVKKEKEIGFSMPVSLARACQSPLLQGKRVFITPNAKPGKELIASLVKASHGQPLERIGRSVTKDDKVSDDLLVVSSEEDYSICKPLLDRGMDVFSAELILNGIVIQKLEYERHRLFVDLVKQTRSTRWLRLENGDQFHPVTKCT